MSYSPSFSPCAGTDWDEDSEQCGRIVSTEEFAMQLKSRTDIFVFDTNTFFKNSESVCLSIAIGVGCWLSIQKVDSFRPDMIPHPLVFTATIHTPPVAILDKNIDVRKRFTSPEVLNPRKFFSRKQVSNHPGVAGGRQGGGNPHSRVMKSGLLALVSSVVKGNDLYGDPFSIGGHAKDIDAILSGHQSLKPGSSTGVGRKDGGVIGFGPGGNGGFGNRWGSDGGDEIDALFNNVASCEPLALKKNPITQFTPNQNSIHGYGITNGRSRTSIMRVVMQNLTALRYAYNQRLREKPGIQGKISMRFAIDEFGHVIFCEVLESSIHDPQFEQVVILKIKRWVFDKIDKPGDVTEVLYPFVFSM